MYCRITANEERCKEHLEAGTALATALTSLIGYEKAAEMAKEILRSGRTMRALLDESNTLSADLLKQVLDTKALTRPSRFRNKPANGK